MIELVIAALLQVATITGDIISTPSADGGSNTTPSSSTVDGGTGTWDDNN